MSKKMYTIWRYALLFADKEDDFGNIHVEYDTGFLYKGKVENIPINLAEKIAEIHPKIFEYYNQNMVILYKGYNSKFKNGTECPLKAIKSLSNKKWIHVKQILDDQDSYPIR